MPLRGEPDPRTLQPGDAFGEYLIDEPLGQGGMGIVFRAVREDGAVVALKVLKPGLVRDENATRRFAREARAAAEVVHPHLIDVIEAGDVDGTAYLAMRYVAGRSLDDRLAEHGPLPVERDGAARGRGRRRARRAARGRLRPPRRQAVQHPARRRARRAADRLRPRQAQRLLDADLARADARDARLHRARAAAGRGARAGHRPLRARLRGLRVPGRARRRSAAAASSRSGWRTSATARRTRASAATTRPPELSRAVLAALAKRPEERPPSATAYAQLLSEAAV